MLGAPMLEGYPLVPLFENQGLGVASFSYDGKLCIGINADRELVPDLHRFVAALVASFAELRAAAAREAPGEDATPAAGTGRAHASG